MEYSIMNQQYNIQKNLRNFIVRRLELATLIISFFINKSWKTTYVLLKYFAREVFDYVFEHKRMSGIFRWLIKNEANENQNRHNTNVLKSKFSGKL